MFAVSRSILDQAN